MPTTFSDLAPVRRVAVGDCSGPLGSGFDALARSAHAALLAAEWTEDSSAPFLPVHDNGQTANKTLPHGDAWKCSYGYDAAARTERSACGAVCYTFRVPADALTGSACNVSAISFRVTGDRYLENGADVHVVLDANAAPPSGATLAARAPDATVCATSSQTEPPNRRHGVTADVELEPAVAATAYIHIALLLHDYTGTRGAWIEGGAMLEGCAVTIEFSRSVSADAGPSVRLLLVTARNASGNTFANVPTAYSFASFYYYTFSPTALAGVDVATAVRLAYAGRLPDVTFERSFAKTGIATKIDGNTTTANDASDPWYLNIYLRARAYHSDAISPGMRITAPTITNAGSAGSFRVALVQHDSIAAVGSENVSVSPSELPAFDQLAAGSGPDLIAVAEGAISASGTATPSLSVVKAPEKPYVSLCLLPIGKNVQLSAPVPGVLVAS